MRKAFYRRGRRDCGERQLRLADSVFRELPQTVQ